MSRFICEGVFTEVYTTYPSDVKLSTPCRVLVSIPISRCGTSFLS